jgi:ABC-type lipoprotein release transport system permease subunit
MFTSFDPDIKITLVKGKTFDTSTPEIKELRKLKTIALCTEVVEENALLRFKEKQMPATIKGVSYQFSKMTQIDSIMYDGKFTLYDGAFYRTVPGIGVANALGLGPHFIDALVIYAPKRTSNINLLRPENSFNRENTFVSGIFCVKQAVYDDHIVLASIDLTRSLFEYDNNTVTSLEIKLAKDTDPTKTQTEIKRIVGDKYDVKNRYEQQENLFKIMKIEKWITYLILTFILLIASFNIIGSLSMLIIDKKEDIDTLQKLGANSSQIRTIFLFEGWLISAVGAITGIVLGSIICLAQEVFGIIRLGAGYVVDAYPVKTELSDLILVSITVLLMGFLAAYYPVKYIKTQQK